MNRRPAPADLVDFPCDYQFKAIGPGAEAEDFAGRVRRAVGRTVPVPLDAIRVRPSSGGRYVAVTVVVRLYNFDQLTAIYAALRGLDGIRFLL